ncbi:SatD family protein [Flavobacteriaceae bacterium MAR_2010_72]|nr:SatD family protein [Flavobacteriaceae bacterium MAR_2010_72]TVZ59994.1 SatD family protein [Flavobacteriaceae bacterium MAR_2010_105]
MTSVITGDIINSKDHQPKLWLDALKDTLNRFGNTPEQWEIYRGDSFQMEVNPKNALEVAILIKASLKQFKKMDVRLAIGIGEKTYSSKHITESNGSAFINSGECFEQLKKTTLAIKSPFTDFDVQLNLMLELALLTLSNWTPKMSLLVKASLEHPTFNQQQLAELFGETQGNISQGLKRAGYDELKKLIQFYNAQIQALC